MTRRAPGAATAWADALADGRALSPAFRPAAVVGGLLMAGDCLIVLGASAGAWLLRHGQVTFPREMVATSLLAVALTLNAMWSAGAYDSKNTASLGQPARVMQAWTAVFMALLLVAYLTKTSDDFSRLWVIGWYGLALAGLAASRVVASGYISRLQHRGRLVRIVAVVDLSGSPGGVVRRIVQDGGVNARLLGVFGRERTVGRTNGLRDLIDLARLFRIDEVVVVVSVPPGGTLCADVDPILRLLATIPTTVLLCPDMPHLESPGLEAKLLFGHAMLTMTHRPLNGWHRVAKRLEDLLVGSAALICLAPIMLIAAAAIKLGSPGPILFKQKRLGFNNNVILVYKFRSMFHDRPADVGVPQAVRSDLRVTRIGRFIRRTSIDELPQILNVLRGEMSLVGPRPHALAHNEHYAELIDDYLGRHRVQPGITGWAQVNGFRGQTDTLDKMKGRVEHDLAYIATWSLLLDLKIMLLTVSRSILDRNAY